MDPQRHHPRAEGGLSLAGLAAAVFYRLKDWRRIATRYDKLGANFAAAVALAAFVIWWL